MFTMMGLSAAPPRDPSEPRLQIIGPLGLRALIRATLSATYATLSSDFVVHELLWPSQPAYPHTLEEAMQSSALFSYVEQDNALPEHVRGQERHLPLMPPHANERRGRDIRMDPDQCIWKDVVCAGTIRISAAPITHRCPTVGYVFEEPPSWSQSISPRELAILDSNTEALFQREGLRHPRKLLRTLLQERQPLHLPDGNILYPPPLDRAGRKVCVLGDTCDASAGWHDRGMAILARDADVLVHECTYASMGEAERQHMRATDAKMADDLHKYMLAPDEALERAVSRGHAVPQIVGNFAALIRARRIVLNHFSARLPAPLVASTEPLTSVDQLQDESRETSEIRFHVMREIERQVTQFWHAALDDQTRRQLQDQRAIAAYDGLLVPLPTHEPSS